MLCTIPMTLSHTAGYSQKTLGTLDEWGKYDKIGIRRYGDLQRIREQGKEQHIEGHVYRGRGGLSMRLGGG